MQVRHPRLGHARSWSATLALILALALALAACGGEDAPAEPSPTTSPADPAADAEPETVAAESPVDALRARVAPARPTRSGPARPYALGFTATPATLTPDAYVDVFDAAARSADLIMLQRPVAWAEVAPGGAVQPETRATIAWERQLLEERGLDLLFAIDPWEVADRGRLAGEAPGDGFGDAAVSDAYVAYAEFVVREYRPRWLALAVDLDAVARARPDDLDAIEAAYRRAYAAVKAIAPETQVFATFQLEDMQGLVPWSNHLPQWSLVLRFQDVLDLLAVSSYPSLIFPFASDIPDSYYSRLETFQKPIALVPGGYASAPASRRRDLRHAARSAALPGAAAARGRGGRLGADRLADARRPGLRDGAAVRPLRADGTSRRGRRREARLVGVGRERVAPLAGRRRR